MIAVRFSRRPETLSLALQGHANAAPRGQDLICCAATTLACTAAQAAQQLWQQGLLAQAPRIRLLPGDALVEVRPTPEGSGQALHCFQTVLWGLSLLERHYPNHIFLERKELDHERRNPGSPDRIPCPGGSPKL